VLGFSKRAGDCEWSGLACIRKDHIVPTKENIFDILTKCLPLNSLNIRAQDVDTIDDYNRAESFIKKWL
jgi:hypothetical protein